MPSVFKDVLIAEEDRRGIIRTGLGTRSLGCGADGFLLEDQTLVLVVLGGHEDAVVDLCRLGREKHPRVSWVDVVDGTEYAGETGVVAVALYTYLC